MAERYWVGGTGTWDSSNTANWSSAAPITITSASRSGTTLTTTGSPALVVGMTVWYNTDQYTGTFTSAGTITGGSGNSWTTSGSGTISSQQMYAATTGASVPTSADNVRFGGYAGSDLSVVTVSGVVNCLSFFHSGLNNFGSSSGLINVFSNFTMNAAPSSAFPAALTFKATTTGKTFYPNTNSYSGAITFDGVGGYWTLGNDLTSTSTLSAVNGTFDTGNYNISAVSFSSNTNSGSSNIRGIVMGSSTITLSGNNYVWIVDDSFGTYTQTRGTSTLILTAATAKYIYCPGYNFYNVVQGGGGALTYTAGGSINDMWATYLPSTIKLAAYGPYTFTNFSLSGSPSGQLTLSTNSSSYPYSEVYIKMATGGGVVNVSYCTLFYIDAYTYGYTTTWNAYTTNGNVDNGGNTGWNFVPPTTGNFLAFF